MAEIKTVKTLKLLEPVQEGDETITELKFRKAIAKDMGDIKMSSEQRFKDYFPMAAKLSGRPQHVIEKLSCNDYLAVCEYLGESMGISPPTGDVP